MRDYFFHVIPMVIVRMILLPKIYNSRLQFMQTLRERC